MLPCSMRHHLSQNNRTNTSVLQIIEDDLFHLGAYNTDQGVITSPSHSFSLSASFIRCSIPYLHPEIFIHPFTYSTMVLHPSEDVFSSILGGGGPGGGGWIQIMQVGKIIRKIIFYQTFFITHFWSAASTLNALC